MGSKLDYLKMPLCHRQKGIVAIIIIFILALAATGVITAYSVRGELTQTTQANLYLAKVALIARAVNDANRPGSLPCPDTNGDGVAESAPINGGECPSYIGLLPWQTLDLPDIRDTAGQRFWYVLSPNFRDDEDAYPINSQISPQINLDNQAEKLMALVIAPGYPLSGQLRANSITIPTAIPNYLDGANADNDANMVFTAQPASSSFNDQLIEIRRNDIFPQVERLALVELRNNLQNYYNSNYQRFPFAANWSDLSASPVGQDNLIGGRLPLGTTTNNLVWSGPDSSTITGLLTSSNCNVDAIQGPTCTFSRTVSGTSTVTMSFRLNKVGLGFFSLLDETAIYQSSGYTHPYITQDIQQVMDATGNVTYNVTGKITFNGLLGGTVTVKANKPPKSAYWDKASSSSWVWKNGWDNYIYYRVGASDMTKDCVTPNLCLTIKGTNSSTVNNPAILMMAGRPLASTSATPSPAQARPSVALKDYFDTTNNIDASNLATRTTATTANRQFDSRFKPSSNVNDQAIGVNP